MKCIYVIYYVEQFVFVVEKFSKLKKFEFKRNGMKYIVLLSILLMRNFFERMKSFESFLI